MSEPAARPHVCAVVLAAGGSRRLGRAKQVEPFREEPLVLHAVRAAREAGANPVLVVVGAAADAVRNALVGSGARIVENARWSHGLSTSLAAGLRAAGSLDPAVDAALVLAADQPLVSGAGLARLLDAHGPTTRVVAAEYDGVRGVPIVVGREHFAALAALGGDRGAGQWLRGRDDVTAVAMPEAGFDVDDEAAVDRMRSHDAARGADAASS